ncbi:Cytochrome P450 4c3 [Carabus blaptoides fortunei]
MGISLHTHHKNVKEYWEAIHGVGDLVIERTLCPWLYYDCIYYLTPSGRKMIKYLKTLHQFSTEVIKNREKMFNENDLDNLNNDDEDIGIYVKRRFAMVMIRQLWP